MSSSIDSLYQLQIRHLTEGDKLRLVELIAHELRGGNDGSQPTEDDERRQEARERFRRHYGAVSMGYATGANNASIDADLAREYGSGSEPQ